MKKVAQQQQHILSVLNRIIDDVKTIAFENLEKAKQMVVDFIQETKIAQDDKKKIMSGVERSRSANDLLKYLYNSILYYEGFGVLSKKSGKPKGSKMVKVSQIDLNVEKQFTKSDWEKIDKMREALPLNEIFFDRSIPISNRAQIVKKYKDHEAFAQDPQKTADLWGELIKHDAAGFINIFDSRLSGIAGGFQKPSLVAYKFWHDATKNYRTKMNMLLTLSQNYPILQYLNDIYNITLKSGELAKVLEFFTFYENDDLFKSLFDKFGMPPKQLLKEFARKPKIKERIAKVYEDELRDWAYDREVAKDIGKKPDFDVVGLPVQPTFKDKEALKLFISGLSEAIYGKEESKSKGVNRLRILLGSPPRLARTISFLGQLAGIEDPTSAVIPIKDILDKNLALTSDVIIDFLEQNRISVESIANEIKGDKNWTKDELVSLYYKLRSMLAESAISSEDLIWFAKTQRAKSPYVEGLANTRSTWNISDLKTLLIQYGTQSYYEESFKDFKYFPHTVHFVQGTPFSHGSEVKETEFTITLNFLNNEYYPTDVIKNVDKEGHYKKAIGWLRVKPITVKKDEERIKAWQIVEMQSDVVSSAIKGGGEKSTKVKNYFYDWSFILIKYLAKYAKVNNVKWILMPTAANQAKNWGRDKPQKWWSEGIYDGVARRFGGEYKDLDVSLELDRVGGEVGKKSATDFFVIDVDSIPRELFAQIRDSEVEEAKKYIDSYRLREYGYREHDPERLPTSDSSLATEAFWFYVTVYNPLDPTQAEELKQKLNEQGYDIKDKSEVVIRKQDESTYVTTIEFYLQAAKQWIDNKMKDSGGDVYAEI